MHLHLQPDHQLNAPPPSTWPSILCISTFNLTINLMHLHLQPDHYLNASPPSTWHTSAAWPDRQGITALHTRISATAYPLKFWICTLTSSSWCLASGKVIRAARTPDTYHYCQQHSQSPVPLIFLPDRTSAVWCLARHGYRYEQSYPNPTALSIHT